MIIKPRKPKIGLIPLVDQEDNRMWMRSNYMEAITAAGGIPLVMPLTDDRDVLLRLALELDGFLITGGVDLDPSLYKEPTLPFCGEICHARDAMEMAFIPMIPLDKPVLAICRGVQALNVALHGSLYQDLTAQRPSGINHDQEKPYEARTHMVHVAEDSPLFTLLGKKRLMVNSMHHQALKDLSLSLKVMATAADGVVEAVWLPGHIFCWGLQWHPEYLWRTDENSRRIFQAFISTAADQADQAERAEAAAAQKG